MSDLNAKVPQIQLSDVDIHAVDILNSLIIFGIICFTKHINKIAKKIGILFQHIMIFINQHRAYLCLMIIRPRAYLFLCICYTSSVASRWRCCDTGDCSDVTTFVRTAGSSNRFRHQSSALEPDGKVNYRIHNVGKYIIIILTTRNYGPWNPPTTELKMLKGLTPFCIYVPQ